MEEILMTLISQYGYLGVFVLILIESVFPPIPSEVILLFSGFLTTITNLNIILLIIFATCGSVIGGLILYLIGSIFNKERLKKILKVRASDIDKVDEWFDTKGNKTVFFCRFVPVLRSLISIPAGMSEMNMPKFLLYTISGSLIWNATLIIVGFLVGDSWAIFYNKISSYAYLILIIFLLICLLIYLVKRKK